MTKMKYKVVCYKCRTTMGPSDTDNIHYFICGLCQEVLDGIEIPKRKEPNLERVRGAIGNVLTECLETETATRDQLIALAILHRVDSEELLGSGVMLPPKEGDRWTVERY